MAYKITVAHCIDPDVLQQVDAAAAKRGSSRSLMVEQILRAWANGEGAVPPAAYPPRLPLRLRRPFKGVRG